MGGGPRGGFPGPEEGFTIFPPKSIENANFSVKFNKIKQIVRVHILEKNLAENNRKFQNLVNFLDPEQIFIKY